MPPAVEPTTGLLALRRASEGAMALAVVLIVGTMIVPLPTPLLDVLLATNLGIAVLLLLVVTFVRDALSVTSFPTLLLLTTLFRLALNVSSTRLILLQADAGEVIRAFGEFVVRGDFVVGAVVFAILTLIQFVVVVRGSERVAEVGARFTLDAMPGKQMAIDAELRSGSISSEEARARRRALERESQLYGAMDGAMKFVRGDAIAGIVILAINLLGGLAIGVGTRGLSLAESLRIYGLLTIGDGLVTQIPALLISVAAGLLVTRVASEDDDVTSLGFDAARQVFGEPRALAIAGALLVALALVPGLPTLPFSILGLFAGGLAWKLHRAVVERRARTAADRRQLRVPRVVPIAIELGPSLERAVSRAALEVEIERARDVLFQETGVELPRVEIRSRPDLDAQEYTLVLHEIVVARAVPAAGASELPLELARALMSAARIRASEFVDLASVQTAIERLERVSPVLVRHAIPTPVSLPLLTEIVRRLAVEGISIRPLAEILEAVFANVDREKDPAELSERVRPSLRRTITRTFAPNGALEVFLLDPLVEDTIRQGIRREGAAVRFALSPSASRDVLEAFARAFSTHADRPRTIVMVRADVRRHVRQLLSVEHPGVAVLAFDELEPSVQVRTLGRVAP